MGIQQFEKEFEVAQLEIQELDEARKSLSEQNKRLKGSVAEAESQCRVVQGTVPSSRYSMQNSSSYVL